MFCQHCGKGLTPESHFCSNCGAAITGQPQPGSASQSRILRPRHPRVIAGVCAGFSQHFGWDLTIVRVLTMVFALFTSGVGFLVYVGAWILMPDAPYELANGVNQQGTTA